MEQYEFADEKLEPVIIDGKYYQRIHNKHINSYGKNGADNIADNVIKIFQKIKAQLSENINHNSLLVGKVQSGKTSNLELFSALAFDNGYNLLVIYGGYDSKLLGQTTKRFKKTFDAEDAVTFESDSPAIFSTEEKEDITNLTEDIINEFIELKKPVILISMKRPPAMKIVNNFLSQMDKNHLKPFVIDDEGDQASLNTKKDKQNDASATYAEIKKIKSLLNNPLYLSVTATPQANIFLDKWSELRPASIWLISPAIGYDGALQYHLGDNNSIQIIDDDDSFDTTTISNSLREAINYFIITSAMKLLLESKTRTYSDMIVHTAKEKAEHKRVYNQIDSYIDQMQLSFKNNDENKFEFLNEFKSTFDKYFSEPDTFDSINDVIPKIVKSIKLILQNSEGKETQANPQLFTQKIFIGGDLLQRGLTFDNLITTYFTRWAKKSGNMDTTLQRARWFGYRSKYFHLCKIFTSSPIAQEFTNLAEIDEDLWEQFADIEAGKMRIDDIIISGENTILRPTSPNKAKFQKIKFKRRWVIQRFIVEDRSIIKENSAIITGLINNSNWKETKNGSQVGQVTGYYTLLKAESMKDIVKAVKNVFEYEPFQKDALLKLLDTDEIVLIQIGDVKKDSPRFRSLYKNEPRIKPLQQGASSLNKEKSAFLGDRFIIVDENKVNIQLYNVAPGNDKNDYDTSLIQYMFAIYVPKEKVYFTKGEEDEFVE